MDQRKDIRFLPVYYRSRCLAVLAMLLLPKIMHARYISKETLAHRQL